LVPSLAGSAAGARAGRLCLDGQGPTLGRPLVDRLKGSLYHNMKELRPGSAGSSEVQLIFAFDLIREAVLPVAGDKSGQWETWYRKAIPSADARFTDLSPR
jgi:hypothetical protein